MTDQEIKQKTKKSRFAVLGDFCLDIYWHADMQKSELSRETPHYPLPIVQERMSAGGAGNVAAKRDKICQLGRNGMTVLDI